MSIERKYNLWQRARNDMGRWLSGIIAHVGATGPAFREGPLTMVHHEVTYGQDGQVSGAVISVWVPREAVSTYLNRISAP